MKDEIKIFHNFFLMNTMIHEVINEDNQYSHQLEHIFTLENIQFLAEEYLLKEINQCLEDDMSFRWKRVRNQIQCWWERIDDELYHKRLDEGESI